jgi:uncharacterized membrane protein
MDWPRLLRLLHHLALPSWWLRRAFPPATLAAIEAAIAASEAQHRGELRFVVEAGQPLGELLHGSTAHERAVELFSRLRVWDTGDNSGVLIYVELVDRHVEIVADRGIDARVCADFWQSVCRKMEAAFVVGEFLDGSLAALAGITSELARNFPPAADNPNELPDRPLLL